MQWYIPSKYYLNGKLMMKRNKRVRRRHPTQRRNWTWIDRDGERARDTRCKSG